MNWTLTAAGFGVGIVVGLTGMGGGALMTPVLVIFFGIPPLAAVSSDLVASAVMKPVGSFVHIRHGRVDWRLVRWLCLGSVPAAFLGVLVIKSMGNGERLQHGVQIALGAALLLAVIGLVARSYLGMAEHAARRAARLPEGMPPSDAGRPVTKTVPRVRVRPLPTVALGAVGGLVTIQSGGTLSAGQSPGTLTVGALNLNAGSTSAFELDFPSCCFSGSMRFFSSSRSFDNLAKMAAFSGKSVIWLSFSLGRTSLNISCAQ